VLALLISGCDPGDTVRLRQLSIVDEQGAERIRLSVADDNAKQALWQRP
jgi:hypothetical protein